MSENTALVPVGYMSIDEVMTVGKTMAESGYFSDAKEAAQACVKILAGREMGFGPFASMTGINIIKGKPAIGGNLMAAAVKKHPKYDYRVVCLDADVCELAFFEGGQELGRSIFTKADADAAEVGRMVAPGASRSMIARFARNILFNRAMSNGVRWYCPDVFLGALVYTPDELGAMVDVEGEIIDLTPTVITTPPPKPGGNGGTGKEKGFSLSEEAMKAILDAKLAEHPANAAQMVNLSRILNKASTTDEIIKWAAFYRAARDEGKERNVAAKQADQLAFEETAEGAA
jgi:hypothetical protein